MSGSTEFPLYRFYGQYILPEKVNIYAQKLPRLQIKEEIQMIRFVQDQSKRTLYNLNTAGYSKIVPLFLPLDKPPSLGSTEPTEKRWTALFISQLERPLYCLFDFFSFSTRGLHLDLISAQLRVTLRKWNNPWWHANMTRVDMRRAGLGRVSDWCT